jgi:hypothetical protein
MLPEISPRCLSCGASVRSEAMFCPECGQSLSQRSGDSDAPIATDEALPTNNPEAESKTAVAAIEGESFAAIADQKVKSEPVKVPPPPTTNPSKSGLRQPAALRRKTSAASPEHERAGVKAREKLHRASTAARGALEENVKRVERIRQVSSVVLEEAHYDPSLRFVLVAVVVFVIVVTLLIVSKVMG